VEEAMKQIQERIEVVEYSPKKRQLKLPPKKDIVKTFQQEGQVHPPVFDDLFELSQYVWDVFHAKLRNVAHIFKLTKRAAEERGEAVEAQFRQVLTTIHAKRLIKKSASIGRECDLLLEYYPELVDTLKGHPLFEKIHRIWELYHLINARLCCTEDITKDELEAFLKLTDEYFDTLVSGWGKPGITPYVHLVCRHAKEFFEIYHNLGQFSTQGFEHKNKVLKRIFRRHTNQGGGASGRKNWQAQALEIETMMIELAKVEI